MLIIYGLTYLSLAAIVASSQARDDPVNEMLIGQTGVSPREYFPLMTNERAGTYLMTRGNNIRYEFCIIGRVYMYICCHLFQIDL